ncbi:unnamed protein product [Prorocentrum cordatum]|uniref:PX domain-containing protein n=1 Tax=Prorocentrum cordatum TaxID=2364126 RepID=A0ABN9RPR2_9DINO|nr:unnamed protein product [Polarella glacialis]
MEAALRRVPQDALSGGRAADDWLPVLVLALSVVLVAVSQLRRALEGPSYKGSRLRANQACRVGCSTLSREIGSLKPASVVDAEREARERQRPRQDARDGQAASLRLPLEPELMDPRTALLPGGEQNPQDGVEFRPTAAATIVVMKRCTENLLLQEQGFEALAQFCKQSPIGKSAVRQAGGMEVVVAAMIAAKLWGVGGTAVALVSALRFLAGDAAIQGGGLLATASLAAGRRHAEDAVSDAGAVPVVAAARRRHDDDAKGQPWGLAALKNLASGERECRQASCQGQVLLANIQVVSQRRKGSNVQTTVSGALAHLAGLSFAVHEEGCHVLVQLALSRASEERAICDAGAAATLARMLQNHASVAEVAKLGRDFAVTAHVERYDVVEAGGGKQIDALKARLSSSGTHVEWTIRVVGQQREPHRLRKRFNEFVTLHEFLRRRLISTPAELPSKSLVRQFNAEYLESRKVALQQYLAALCARRDAMNCPEVQRFLGLPELDVGGEAAQVAEVQEGSFGVVSVSFDAVQGLLLLGSTSASLRSKLDNAVGGMKLPWGGSQSPQQGPPTSQMTLWRQSPGQLRFDVATACKYTPSLSGVAMCHTSDRGCLCLCGLGDGRVGHFSDRGRDSTAASAALPLLCHTAAVEALEVDEAEETLFSVSRDMSLIAYDLRRQTVRCEARTQSAVNSMRYCGTQRRLFCAMADGRVSVWDTSSVPIRQLALVPDVAAGRCPPVVSMDYDAALETLFTATKARTSSTTAG